jgi:hypothetical protein
MDNSIIQEIEKAPFYQVMDASHLRNEVPEQLSKKARSCV